MRVCTNLCRHTPGPKPFPVKMLTNGRMQRTIGNLAVKAVKIAVETFTLLIEEKEEGTDVTNDASSDDYRLSAGDKTVDASAEEVTR